MRSDPRFWLQLVRVGARSLRVHKLRSSLTMLGMVFGVASVVSILAIGEGASYEVQAQLRRLGPDRIVLRSVLPNQASASGSKDRIDYGLKLTDLARIESLVPGVASIAPSYALQKDVHQGATSTSAPLVCTTPSFLGIHQLGVSRGRFLTDSDLETAANVAVLGAKVARTLFGAEDPVGQDLKLGSGQYRVVGLLKPRADRSAALHDPNDSIFLPVTTGRMRLENVARITGGGGRRYECVEVHEIGLRVQGLERIDQQAAMLRRLIAEAHPIVDYEIRVPFEELRTMERTKSIFAWVLGSIAGISLLVGGIGIMNIMLATVTERTREIGIRRALGAKRWHVVLQFVVETVLLSVCGGILGLGLGLAIPAIVEWAAGMKTIVTIQSMVLALGISVVVGVVFGLYPARRAARMDPIEALRYA
jgi:putative ABC transport system permease protein